MGDRRRRLAREDLEAMRQEFVVGEQAGSLDDDLHQIRRSARLGVSPEDWARARSWRRLTPGRFGGTWIRDRVDAQFFGIVAENHSFGGCAATAAS